MTPEKLLKHVTDVKALLGYGWFIVCLFVFLFLKVFMNIGENSQKDVKWSVKVKTGVVTLSSRRRKYKY